MTDEISHAFRMMMLHPITYFARSFHIMKGEPDVGLNALLVGAAAGDYRDAAGAERALEGMLTQLRRRYGRKVGFQEALAACEHECRKIWRGCFPVLREDGHDAAAEMQEMCDLISGGGQSVRGAAVTLELSRGKMRRKFAKLRGDVSLRRGRPGRPKMVLQQMDDARRVSEEWGFGYKAAAQVAGTSQYAMRMFYNEEGLSQFQREVH